MRETFFPSTSMPDRDWWQALWPDPDEIIRRIGIGAGMKIVDLCCGDGYFTVPISKLSNTRVYALDIDPAMLDKARRQVLRHGGRVTSWICADARDLPDRVPPEMDFVLLANTFHGVPDPTGLSRVVARVLRPGGRFGIVNWHPLPREQTTVLGCPRGPRTEMRMSPGDVRMTVEPAGFSLDFGDRTAPLSLCSNLLKVSDRVLTAWGHSIAGGERCRCRVSVRQSRAPSSRRGRQATHIDA